MNNFLAASLLRLMMMMMAGRTPDSSDTNLGNSNTVLFCGKMAAQQRYRGAVQAGKNVRTVQKLASCYVGSSPSHINTNSVLPPKTSVQKPQKPLRTASVSLKEDLEMSSEEEEADDDAISNEESARYVKRKYEDDTKSVKKLRKQSVVKSNPRGRGKYSMFCNAEGVDQSGRGKTKRRRVKSLLCNNDKSILSGNFEKILCQQPLKRMLSVRALEKSSGPAGLVCTRKHATGCNSYFAAK